MSDDPLSLCLDDKWRMFFVGRVRPCKFTPVQTLSGCLDLVNQYLQNFGHRLCSWPEPVQEEAARLVWVNWIYHRLQHEPIRKPITCHWDGESYKVICGDTRLMALSLFSVPPMVSAAVIVDLSHMKKFKRFPSIVSSRDLLQIAGFNVDSRVLCRASLTQGLDWLEIADQTTSHHLHDVSGRLTMLQSYIDVKSQGFVFTEQWCRQAIDWPKYQARL